MPAEQRSSRGADRCSVHPGSSAVATCDGCGRSLCLWCAIPVRGTTLGAECLPDSIGLATPARIAAREPRAAGRRLARWAFGLAVLATVLPWSRVGTGAGAFGAWGRSPRWSMGAAIAAALGLLVSVVRPFAPSPGRSWDAVLTAAGALVAAAAAMAIWQPPDFSAPWIGPWLALGAGLLACAASGAALRRERETDRVRG